MKRQLKYTAIMGALMLAFTGQALAHNHETGSMDKTKIEKAYEDTARHQAQVKLLSEQLEVMNMKKELAEIIYSCRQKGVLCKPNAGDLGVEYVGVDDARLSDTPDGMAVPEGLGATGLQGSPLLPGDDGYDPRFDPNSPQNQPQQTQIEQVPEYVPAEPEYLPEESEVAVNDADNYNNMEQPIPVEEFDFEVQPEPMPELIGVENEFAIFMMGGREVRVRGGQKIPGTEWKVRDVSFNNVWMQDVNGDSERVYLTWQ